MNNSAQTLEVRRQKEGAAIMLALWALFLLSALVISWALDIDSRLALSGDGTRMLKAEAAACSGAEVAFNPTIDPSSPNLKGSLNDGANYEARMTGEGGRLNVNWIVAGENQPRLGVLRQYLENKGIDLNERDTMVDSLLDWVEPNIGVHHLNAPPESDDYHPAHAPLTRIEELKKVAGWAEFTSTPGWDDDFTVSTTTQSGIDLRWASRDVLLALPGLTPEVVDRYLQIRQGQDGVDGTEDDGQINGMAEALSILGIRNMQQTNLNGLVAFNVPIFRVVSVGRAGRAQRTVQMVFKRVGLRPQIFTWKEF